MIQPRIFLATLCSSAILALASCEDVSEKTQAGITGYWKLTKALRNDRETGTLEGVFFEFRPDGKMLTNLPVGADAPVEFEVDKKNIVQKSAQPVRYEAVTIEDSTLVLRMEMRGVTFEMQLKRSAIPVDTLTPPTSDTTTTQ